MQRNREAGAERWRRSDANWRCLARIFGDPTEAEQVRARSTGGGGEVGALVEARDRPHPDDEQHLKDDQHLKSVALEEDTVPVGRLGLHNRRRAASTCAMALFF
jgi:hypothetical protein